MTVQYSNNVATTQGRISVFFKLLFRWRGSIYMLVWKDLLWFCTAYTSLSLVYRLALNYDGKTNFEDLVVWVKSQSEGQSLPMTFILGFFVPTIIKHRQEAFKHIPNIDSLVININLALKGDGEALRLRKQLVRYGNLAYALTMANISPQMKKRLPTLKHYVETGLLSEEECKTIAKLEDENRTTHWVPIVWATNILDQAFDKGLLTNDKIIYEVMKELHKLKLNCEALIDYDTLTIPLIYTQVVTMVVYAYGVSVAIGQQFLDPERMNAAKIEGYTVDYYVPIFTIIQFIVYFGWLRVGETMMNSMGEDDDDFPINAVFDRNCEVTQCIVTDMHGVCQKKKEDDPYLEEELPPFPIPYTVAARAFQERANAGSFQHYKVEAIKRKVLVKRRRGDQVDVDVEGVQTYNFEVEGETRKKCSPCCSCCSKPDYDSDMEAVSVDELEQTRRRRRDKLRRRKPSEKDTAASA